MKLFWTGTDSLMLVDYNMRTLKKKPYWFAFRILIRIMEFFIEGHYHDGSSRLRRECEIQGIPYYWSYQSPDKHKAIRSINKELLKKIIFNENKNKKMAHITNK